MADQPANDPVWTPLLKYPVILVVIVIGLWVAETCFDIDLSRLTKIGPGGIELQEVQGANAAATGELETRINELLARVGRLEAADPRVTSQPLLATDSTAAVSDLTARVATAGATGGAPPLLGKRGYIWIGNYSDESRRWNNPVLRQIDGRRPPTNPPGEIRPGTEYHVSGNMVLRDGLPDNDDLYYRGRLILGVVPKGTRVRIIEQPRGIPRKTVVQYWARIQVLQ